MNRQIYFNEIEEKLTILSIRVKNRGKLNVLDLHIHSENFYRDFLNLLFSWNLINENNINQNVEAIDLIDETQKLVVQVSATATKKKINDSLSKDNMKKYAEDGYKFKFVSIAENADSLRKLKYSNIHSISFDPSRDILDIQKLEDGIKNLKIDELENMYHFIKAELGRMPDSMSFNSDLTSIINILAAVKLEEGEPLGNINKYAIDEKIEFNKLDIAAVIINEYKIFYNQVDKKYKEFDKMGLNKSMLVLQSLQKMYVEAIIRKKYENSDVLFIGLIDEVKQIVLSSANYDEISREALDVCASLLVVDAFMRCKVFKNPEGYEYVIA